jgi:RNA polymerase sigma factor (sigma-70 family)
METAEDDASSDRELILRFVRTRDEAAFAALVRRHGPMVWGVCRRVLRHHHDAEDAFQATFIILARKAPTLRDPGRLQCWLYGVACRVAAKARTGASQRKSAEPLIQEPLVGPGDELLGRETADVLDEEIARLPEKFRDPVIQCYLLGLTNEEAARRIGCPKGTIQSRLSTARQRLRDRLVRRGLTLSAATLTALAAGRGSAAEIAGSLYSSTLDRALTAASTCCAAVALAQGVLLSMTLKKLATVALVLAVVITLAAGGFVATMPFGSGSKVRADDGPKPAFGGQESDKSKAAEVKPGQVEKAKAEVEDLYHQLEKMEEVWLEERLKAMRDQAQMEEAMGAKEQGHIAKGQSLAESIRSATRDLRGLRMQEADQVNAGEAKEKIDQTRKQIAEAEKSLDALTKEPLANDKNHSGVIFELRMKLTEQEEMINHLNRKQAAARSRLQAIIERAEDKVNRLEADGECPSQESALEKKLDRLLKEVGELRQELKHVPPPK